MSSFRWGMVAWSTLTYDQMACRNVQASLVFSSLQYCCFPSCFCLSWAWLHQLPSTFCDGTQSFVGREHATIHDMKALMILFLKTLIALRFKDKTGLFKANGPFKCLSPRINYPAFKDPGILKKLLSVRAWSAFSVCRIVNRLFSRRSELLFNSD